MIILAACPGFLAAWPGWISVKKPRFINSQCIFSCLVLFAVALGLSACGSRLNTRGNLLDPDRLADIRPGELSRDEVAEILGSPSSVTPFGSDTWYYISQRTETFAFFSPVVVERQIVMISFSKDGKVIKVDTLGLDQGMTIDPIERTTPTHGNKLTVIEQLVGNLGRFKKKKARTSRQEQ